MHGAKYTTILVEEKPPVIRITLNRPEIHNPFNEVVLAELTDIFRSLQNREDIRIVVLTGKGKSFCAGADLHWMKKMKDYTLEENIADAEALAECMYLLYTLPQATICRINGAAIGGGMGLVSACDICIAAEHAVFSLSEIKLGLIPSCISPYVIRRAGEGRCRELFLTGERFNAARAREAGLVNRVVPLEGLDRAVEDVVKGLATSGPRAITHCKELIRKVSAMSLDEAKPYTARSIAELRIGDEGQEGISAFFEKRKPSWAE